MPINSASIPALRVARAVKRRRRAEGGEVGGDWQDREAKLGLALQQADAERQKASERTWGDTARDVAGFPRRMYQSLSQPSVAAPVGPAQPRDRLAQARTIMSQPGPQNIVPNLAHGLYEAGVSGFTAPHDAYTGQMPMTDAEGNTSPEAIRRGFDLAAIAGGASAAGTAERAAAGTGMDFRVAGRQVLASDSQATGAPLAALEHAPKFYSGLERAVEAIPQPRMTGDQWLGTLNNRGVKPEEMDWTGLRSFLAERGNQPVTKVQVAEHLGANKLELGEVEKLQNNSMSRERFDALPEAEQERLASNRDQATKFQDYQLHGGENYREKLLTLPDKTRAINQSRQNEIFTRREAIQDQFDALYGKEDLETIKARKKLTAEFNDLTDELQKLNQHYGDRSSIYKSSHWDEPNVLVHRRTNERDVNGQRSLHIEEIQSDWHQQGRQKGYADSGKDWTAEKTQFAPGVNGFRVRDARGNEIANVSAASADEAIASARQTHARESSVPDAPFRKNWHELALKDAIREAAEKGFDRISWTPGEAQAARYDLSKQISGMAYRKKDGADHGSLVAYGHGKTDGPVIQRSVTDKELPDVIGKEAAERLLKSEPKRSPNFPDAIMHELNGLDLKVGGEGMKGFYDKMIPDALNKIGKPHGVKVQSGETLTKDNILPEGGHVPPDRMHLLSAAQRASLKPKTAPVHYMDIPQSLKDQVLKKGFSLFEDSAAVGAPLAAAQNDNDLVASLLAEQESRKKPKKSVIRMPERKAGGLVTSAAMNVARSIKRAKGGKVHVGPIVGDTGGRADKVPMEVPNGSYVLTSDHCSAMGEGNTLSGFQKLKKMFPKSVTAYKAAKARVPAKRAAGGPVPILAADGEFIICPEDIIDRYGDLDEGHRILDHWQTTERKNHIKTLSKLAPPARD